jgi:hypothetical protein
VTACGVLRSISAIPRSRYHSAVAAAGARPDPLKAITSASPLGPPPGAKSTKQSPPMPVDCGSTTHCTAQAATAASIALPPSCRTRIAVMVASGWEVAAMPFSARTAERPGSSRFLMAFFYRHLRASKSTIACGRSG